MKPIEWLNINAPGFSDLSGEERDAIMHFSLLWSFFEAETLGTSASANSILALSRRWESSGRLRIALYAHSLAYFKSRYFSANALTTNFHGLNFRQNDQQELVGAVIRGENTGSADSVAALLIIVFRLRNNLFHGVKWAYGIQGQHANFCNANDTLMAALETHMNLTCTQQIHQS